MAFCDEEGLGFVAGCEKETGAVDVRPGEVEGLAAPEGAAVPSVPQKSRAQEKRKREIEERRRLLEAKRRKKEATSHTPEPAGDFETPVFSMPMDDDEPDEYVTGSFVVDDDAEISFMNEGSSDL